MSDLSQAALALGSQAGSAVLIEQPQAYITQKARQKRDRRTEWEYFVQFPGFPGEGAWYSARAIKTQHPQGVELIREFESAGEEVDTTHEAAQQPVPLTQDAGPSQIGHAPPPSQHQLFTQQQAPSQIITPATNPTGQSATQPLQAGFQPAHREQHWQPPHHSAAADSSHAFRSYHNLPQAPARYTSHHREALPYGEQYSILQGQEQMRQDKAREQAWQSSRPQPASLDAAAPHLPHAYLPISLQQHQHSMPLQQQHIPLQQGQQIQVPASAGMGGLPPWRDTYVPHGHPMSVMPQTLPHHPNPSSAAYPGSLLSNSSLAAPPATAAASSRQPATLSAPLPSAQHPEHVQPGRAVPQHGQAAYTNHAVPQSMTSPARHHALETLAASGHNATAADQAIQSGKPPAASEPKKAGTLQLLSNDLTSRILSEKANQWRQTDGKKGTGLLNLVPSGAKQLQQHRLANVEHKGSHQAGPSSQQQSKQPEQDVDAFVPAVQDCIAAANLPLSRPFYQAVMAQAMQQGPKTKATAAAAGTGSSTQPGNQAQLATSPSNAQHTGIADANHQATAADANGLFLCPDQVGDVERYNAHVHIAADMWQSASIKGARRVGDSLELHVVWTDGFDVWLSLEALKKQEHCKSAIIDFLVSKVRKRSKG